MVPTPIPSAGPGQLVRAARGLLAGGRLGDGIVHRRGIVEAPMIVHDDAGEPHSWFVPVTVDGRLVAFFQFRGNGTFMRHGAFPPGAGSHERCPLLSEWFAPDRVQARVRDWAPGETPGEPVLSFDRTPDRLVWRVRLTQADGGSREVFVVGDRVFEPPGSRSAP